MGTLIDFSDPCLRSFLPVLLQDHTTGKNIIWATDPPPELDVGFADEIMQRTTTDEVEAPQVSMLYSKANVVNSLMDKVAAKCAIKSEETRKTKADDLMDRLNLIKNWR